MRKKAQKYKFNHNKLFTKRYSQTGFSSIELALVLPMVVLFILIFIGLGYTLMVKQNSMVTARFAATYQSKVTKRGVSIPVKINDDYTSFDSEIPSNELMKKVAHSPEDWQASFIDSSFGDVLLDGLINQVLGPSARKATLNVITSAKPTKGIIVRFYDIGQAQASYEMATGTWNCGEIGDNYFTILLSNFGVNLSDIPGFDLVFGDGCCDNYKEE